ncbi:MAG: hypothetical protein CM1200mP16_10710 [Nitrospina sp.]|nr:MAG: hypothetical protein CM1200mP16_10710 [Nitrospina sp.]
MGTEEKGNFAHSREINSSFILLASLMGFMMMGDKALKTFGVMACNDY